jgi:hypothetical protein
MPIARSRLRPLVAALLIAGLPLGSAAARLSEAAGVSLGARGYAWEDTGTGGPVRVIVSRARQRAYVYRGGVLIGVAAISTGKVGHRTPLGEFTILQKAVHHRSNKYSNAPMPYMQRLTWGGIALHAGPLPGYPASHGCIRLPHGFAQKLFAATTLGAYVQVTDDGPDLPRVEMAQAAPPPAKKAPLSVPGPVPAVVPSVRLAAAPVPLPVVAPAPPVPVQLASAELPRPASWKEQSAEDFVTWGSSLRSTR